MVRVVNHAVHHCIGDRLVIEEVMPQVHRYLTGDEPRACSKALVYQFKEVALRMAGKRFQTPVVQNQKVETMQLR